MSTWSTLTEAEVLQELSSTEQSAINSTKSSDDLSSIVTRVIAKVRDAIEAGGNQLGDSGEIPDGLKPEAIAICRWQFVLGLPKNELLQSAVRKDAHDTAQAYLRDIADGKVKVPPPDDIPHGSEDRPGRWGGQDRLDMRTNKDTDDD